MLVEIAQPLRVILVSLIQVCAALVIRHEQMVLVAFFLQPHTEVVFRKGNGRVPCIKVHRLKLKLAEGSPTGVVHRIACLSVVHIGENRAAGICCPYGRPSC